MTNYLVIEGESDRRLLEQALPAKTKSRSRIIVGGGVSSAVSLAKTLALQGKLPVAVILDADTENEARIRSQIRIYEDLIHQAMGTDRTRARVFLAKPSLEHELFAWNQRKRGLFKELEGFLRKAETAA
ncbi:hypothetical protein N0B44_22280 [Roseibacterium beibuensis]|uniref:hypothetical protein n=1 Tax=[Roseibacterium] beibuensis TaxID=1193142 RepID=UPI00217DB705|nr:hypothetical protein [Roseibacterium beibuensis]MCS6625645.1 hypothetical protein [Roseibacterium beibuensis]